jgi:hypothetical protein
MRRYLIAICAVVLVTRSVAAEDPVAAATESAKPREVQLNDIITVLMDRQLAPDDAAESPRVGPPVLTHCAASVVGIRANGNLEIESRSKTIYNGEIWERSLTGIVNPKTVGAHRAVHCDDIVECHIRTFKKGAVSGDVSQPVLPSPQVCPRPGAPYAPTPVGLVTSPSAPKVAVLHEKQADLAQLQQEINQLRAEAGAEQQILVRVQVMEVSLTKMENRGFDAVGLSSGFANMSAADAKQLIHRLSENNLGKMLSEPTVIALDGHPASVHAGGEIPYPSMNGEKGTMELKPTGTQLDVVPQTLGDNRVRLDFRVRVSDTDSGQLVEINGSHVPVLNVREIDTKIETAFGNSVVLSGMEETRIEARSVSVGKTEDVENRIGTIFIVTPEAADRVATLPSQPRAYTPK